MIRRPSGRRPTPAARPVRPAVFRLAGRPGSSGSRRTHPVRRASAGLTPVRAGALLALLAGIAALYGVASTEAFTVQRTEVTGNTWTPDQEIRAAMALPESQNAFALRTADLAGRLLRIPAVRTADVSVALPDQVRVAITEREALMAWKAGDRQFLVDGSGLLFAELDDTGQAGAALPVIDDRRAVSTGLGVGSVLDAVTLEAALRLGSLVPADIGSSATNLDLRVDDTDGFVMRGRPVDWTAVFGFYTPTLRTPEMIPGQVRLLQYLLLGREDNVLKVILADERSGTYVPRATPAPTAKPSATPAP